MKKYCARPVRKTRAEKFNFCRRERSNENGLDVVTPKRISGNIKRNSSRSSLHPSCHTCLSFPRVSRLLFLLFSSYFDAKPASVLKVHRQFVISLQNMKFSIVPRWSKLGDFTARSTPWHHTYRENKLSRKFDEVARNLLKIVVLGRSLTTVVRSPYAFRPKPFQSSPYNTPAIPFSRNDPRSIRYDERKRRAGTEGRANLCAALWVSHFIDYRNIPLGLQFAKVWARLGWG